MIYIGYFNSGSAWKSITKSKQGKVVTKTYIECWSSKRMPLSKFVNDFYNYRAQINNLWVAQIYPSFSHEFYEESLLTW